MGLFANLVIMTCASAPGTGTTITLSGAATVGGVQFLTGAQASVTPGAVYDYALLDPTNGGCENGTITWPASGLTLTGRTVVNSSNGNAAINASADSLLYLSPIASSLLAFPSGTKMLFQQSSAPTGWTKDTTFNDAALRVVNGSTSSGGTNGFSTVNAQTAVGNTTLSTAQMPSHDHPYTKPQTSGMASSNGGCNSFLVGGGTAATTGANGSGAAHNHSITMDMKYVDIIIATRN
jgi:hypothetical protein